ncbi:MAG: hypothetical protein V4529_16520 [Gemmatimonadota bacterium]
MTASGLRERVDELRAWARNRIEHCRRQEAKFGCGDIAIEAATERRSLTAVLAILGEPGQQGCTCETPTLKHYLGSGEYCTTCCQFRHMGGAT